MLISSTFEPHSMLGCNFWYFALSPLKYTSRTARTMERKIQQSILSFVHISPKLGTEEEQSAIFSQNIIDIKDYLTEHAGIVSVGSPAAQEDPPSDVDESLSVSTTTNTSAKKFRRTWGPKKKKTIVQEAVSMGTNKAAMKYRIRPTLLRKWKAQLREAENEAIEQASILGIAFLPPDPLAVFRDKRADFSGRNRLPASVEAAICERIQILRRLGVTLDTTRLRLVAASAVRSRIKAPTVSQYKTSITWARRFIKRNGISRRRVTRSSDPGGVESAKEKMIITRLYLARLAIVQHRHRIPPELCYHADETGVQLLTSEHFSYDFKGTKTVTGVMSGEKRQATAMIGGNVRGMLLAPFVIFSEISNDNLTRALQLSPPVFAPHIDRRLHTVVWAKKDNQWMDVDAAKAWIEKVLIPASEEQAIRLGLPNNHPILLTWDVYSSHRKDILKWLCEEYPHVKVVFVPARCTSFLQLFDVGLARPFKRELARQKEQWIYDEIVPIVDAAEEDVIPEFECDKQANEQEIANDELSDRQDAEWATSYEKEATTTEMPMDEVAAKLAECSRLKILRPKVIEWICNANAMLEEKSLTDGASHKIGMDIALDPSKNGEPNFAQLSRVLT